MPGSPFGPGRALAGTEPGAGTMDSFPGAASSGSPYAGQIAVPVAIATASRYPCSGVSGSSIGTGR
jgi:hypothetical protein